MPEEDNQLIERIRRKMDAFNAPFGRDCHGKPWHLELEYLMFGMTRLIVTDGRESAEQWWEYETEAEANAAIELWMEARFEGEPTGWRRASPEDRDSFDNRKIRYRAGLKEEQAEQTVILRKLTEPEKVTLKMMRPFPIVKYDPVKEPQWK